MVYGNSNENDTHFLEDVSHNLNWQDQVISTMIIYKLIHCNNLRRRRAVTLKIIPIKVNAAIPLALTS